MVIGLVLKRIDPHLNDAGTTISQLNAIILERKRERAIIHNSPQEAKSFFDSTLILTIFKVLSSLFSGKIRVLPEIPAVFDRGGLSTDSDLEL
jgi:hypothetical protein